MPKSWALVTLTAVLAGSLFPAAARGAEIGRVRMGTHPRFSRVVFEVSAPFRFTLRRLAPSRVLVSFPGSRLAAKLVIRRWSDARIRRIGRSGARGVVLVLAPGRFRLRRFRLNNPHRLVVDVILPAKPAAAKPSRSSPRKPSPPGLRPAFATPAASKKPSWTMVKSIRLSSRRGLSRLVMSLSARALSSLQREGDRVTLTLRGVRLAPGVDVAGLSDALVPGVSTQDNGRGTVRIRFSLARSDLSVDSSFIPSENRLVIDVLRAGVAATRGLRAKLARLAPWPDDKLGPAPRPGLWPTFPSVVGPA
ncbi:MAG: hypothetical protein KJ621_01885, partial [Proteobacteria bacterium]|nr:hypothetical protein [Pseudomonadota bacterium]